MTTTGEPRIDDRRTRHDADRETAVSMLRSALSTLAGGPGDGWSNHDGGILVTTHGGSANEPECRTTRAAMHDYLTGRLLPRRQRRLESHMDACAECTRAFIDVREISWTVRGLGRPLVDGRQHGRRLRALRRHVGPPATLRPATTPQPDGGH